MAWVEPDTEVRLLRGVPLHKGLQHTIFWSNIGDQTTYMLSKTAYVFNPQTYQRVDSGVMRCQQTYANVITCGYMMFRNKSHDNKWFYAFIDSADYINESTTEISYTVDVMQSWMFDYKILPCFIEREHCDDDSIGANLVPETVDTGKLICSTNETAISSVSGYNPALMNIVISYQSGVEQVAGVINRYELTWDGTKYIQTPVTDLIAGTPIEYYHNFLPSGVLYENIPYDRTDDISVKNALNRLWKFQNAIDTNERGMEIVGIYIIDQTSYAFMNDNTLNGVVRTWRIEQPTSFPSVDQNPAHDLPFSQVKNNKLFTYPYQYLKVDDNHGSTQEYPWERLTVLIDPDTNQRYVNAELYFALSPAPMIMAMFPYANGEINNAHSALIFDDFIPIPYSTDSFSRWWTQNKSAIASDVAMQGLKLGLSTLSVMMSPNNIPLSSMGFSPLGENLADITGKGFGKTQGVRQKKLNSGMTGSAVEYASSLLGTMGNASALKDGFHNFYSGTNPLLIRYAKQSITAYGYTLTADVAKRIDHYFSVYGYAVNDIKTPNIQDSQGNWQMVRDNWYYVKTVKSYVEGDIPNDVHDEIENIFNTGITFWNDPSHLGDYSYYNWDNEVS